MKIYSLVQNGFELKPVEVEISLMPGLPQFQIMGLPDAAIKESQLRIKSALKCQGFELPSRQQVLINLRPSHERKSSQGLELAIAVAYLLRTGQVPLPEDLMGGVCLYGQLSLDGSVAMPANMQGLINSKLPWPVLTGPVDRDLGFSVYSVASLQDLARPQFIRACDFTCDLEPPPLPEMKFSRPAAHLISMVATGEHSLLLAGPAGSGKSTLGEALLTFLRPPSPSEFREITQVAHWSGRRSVWRPLVCPHHTIPTLSMVGGGVPPFPGEITRAHRGVLLLDELLEFHPHVRESLREPLTSGEITVSRRGKAIRFPAKFLCVATTNLCPCGDFEPGKFTQCRFSLVRCRSYSEKLSGPLADRFEVMAFSSGWGEELEVTSEEIKARVDQAVKFARDERGQEKPNTDLDEAELTQSEDLSFLEGLLPVDLKSRRRRLSILKVARTCADLEGSLRIKAQHLGLALEYAWLPYLKLRQAFS